MSDGELLPEGYSESGGGGGGGAPTNATYVTLTTNATLTNERVLTGTANQVILTDNGAGSTVVLSLPQSIATTSTPQFASIGLGKVASPAIRAEILVDGTFTQGLRIEGTTAAALGYNSFVTGDAQIRFTARVDGLLAWGSGASVTDVTLSRSGVGILSTNAAFTVATNLSVGTASASQGKIRLFNASSNAEYNIWNNPDSNIPYDSLWFQRVYSQSTVGDPFATLTVVRAPENAAVITSVDTTANTVTTVAPHLFNTGTGVIVQNSGGGVPGGLIASTFYGVRAVSATVLAFYPTIADANADTNRIDLTTSGSGTNTVYLATQEATTTYQRMKGTSNEFMDVYANGYEDSMEFGIRVQRRGGGSVLRPWVLSNYDGSSRNTILYVDNVNNRIGAGGNVAPTVAFDLTGALRTTGEIAVHSAGTATMAIDRGAITNFGLHVFRTAATDEWIVGMINNSTNNFYIQDAVNGFAVLAMVQGATPSITAAGTWTFSNVVTINNPSVASQLVLAGSSANLSQISTSASDASLNLVGNRTAASGSTADVIITSAATRTTGMILNVTNNTSDRFQVAFWGGVSILTATNASGARVAFAITNTSQTAQTAGAEITNFNIGTYTRQWATGTVAQQREWRFNQPTFSAVAASVFTIATGLEISPPTAGTNARFDQNLGFNISGSLSMGASAATTTYRAFNIAAQTITVTGTTQVTSVVGFAGVAVMAMTITDASAVTINAVAGVYISGAPIAAGSVTLTKSYSLWIDAGLPRIDSTSANSTTATVLGSLGPAGASTTVQEWLTIDINGTTRFIPCF